MLSASEKLILLGKDYVHLDEEARIKHKFLCRTLGESVDDAYIAIGYMCFFKALENAQTSTIGIQAILNEADNELIVALYEELGPAFQPILPPW